MAVSPRKHHPIEPMATDPALVDVSPDAPTKTDWMALAKQGLDYGRRIAAVSHLALRSAGELTDLVAEMHHTISQAPLPFKRFDANAKAAPFPYRIVAGSLRQTATALAAIPKSNDLDGRSTVWRRFRAIANGVAGDKLARWDNALGYELGLYSLAGERIEADVLIPELATQPPHRYALFAHGLCNSELDWDNAEHRRFAESLTERGYRVAYLRYNTGRAIHENGTELACLLEQYFGRTSATLLLIGHSMGGLLYRSAFAHARQQGMRWLARVSHTAYLGSPHHGAPLEKVGNLANALLGYTPYTAPLMRLGNIRSRAIKDLRHGCITPEDSQALSDEVHHDPRQSVPALPQHVNHFLIAASMEQTATAGQWLGDGLVPVTSAFGHHEDSARQLSAPQLQREHIQPLGHLAMLGDVRVYRALRHWLGLSG